MKSICKGCLIFFGLLIAAALVVHFLFKDKIMAAVKGAANESLTASLDFKDVDISLFRNFPKLSVGLEGLDITGTGAFEGVKLVQCERMDVAVDFWSAVTGNEVIVRGLYLDKPDIKVYVLKDGKANYDITKPAPEPVTTTETAASPIKLEHYEIKGGKVYYDDRGLYMIAEIVDLDHEGKGNLYTDLYDLAMKTRVGQLSLNYGGMQYLSKAKADWDVVLGADMKNMKFTFKDNIMKVNALALNLDGFVQMPNETDMLMDLKFGTPENSFKNFLSIIPGAYTKDYEGVQANGSVQCGGVAK